MDRSESVGAMENVNERRVGVRSIAWLDAFCGARMPNVPSEESDKAKHNSDLPESERKGLTHEFRKSRRAGPVEKSTELF